MSAPKTILVIDDDPDVLEILKASLAIFGEFEVTTASSGAQGCQLAEDQPFDVIFTDLIMPGLDGEDVVERIRVSKFNKDSLIFVVTATADVAAALQMENIEIVPKPIDPNSIVDLIWMNWHRRQADKPEAKG